jgi:spore germination protein YaaH
MKINIIRNLLGGLSLSSALFMFQACYGTPQDVRMDVLIEGKVTSAASGNPISGIKISASDGAQYQFSDNEGKFSFYSRHQNKWVHFEDVDSTDNGSFLSRDTVLTNVADYVYLDIELEEQ